MQYKSDSNVDPVISKELHEKEDPDDEEIENLVIKTFDSLLPQLYATYESGDIDGFNDDAMPIFYQLSGKYPSLFKHTIESQFIDFLLDSLNYSVEYLSKEENRLNTPLPYTATVLQLIIGLCNCPTPIISQYLLESKNFFNNLKFYINYDNVELSSMALTILGSILYDAKDIHLSGIESLLPDPTIVLKIIELDPEMKDIVFRDAAYIIELMSNTTEKGGFINAIIPFITPDCKLGLLLNSFTDALLTAENPDEIIEAFSTNDFLEGKLVEIAIPTYIESDITEWETKKTNSYQTLKLILAINSRVPELGEHLLQQISYDRLVDNRGKEDDLIALSYEIISIAIPNRSWLPQLLIDNRVLYTLCDVLDGSVYNLKLSGMKMLNTLLKNTPESKLADLFSDIFTEKFINNLLDLLQSGLIDLIKQVLEIIVNLIVLAKKIGNLEFLELINTDEFRETIDSIENDQAIPVDQEWKSNIIGEIHDLSS